MVDIAKQWSTSAFDGNRRSCMPSEMATTSQAFPVGVDQNASFTGRAFNDSFYQDLPLGRPETVCQQWRPYRSSSRGDTNLESRLRSYRRSTGLVDGGAAPFERTAAINSPSFGRRNGS